MTEPAVLLAYVACTFLWMQRVCGCSLFTLLSLRCSRCWLIMRRLSAGESRLCCFVAESFAVYIVTAPVTTTFPGEEPNRVIGVSQSRPLGPRARVFKFRCSHSRLHTAGFHLDLGLTLTPWSHVRGTYQKTGWCNPYATRIVRHASNK